MSALGAWVTPGSSQDAVELGRQPLGRWDRDSIVTRLSLQVTH